MKYTHQDILQELNLNDFFINQGFKFVQKDSTVRWKVYFNPENQCKYVLGNPKGQWIYKNSQTDSVFKNIFDFVREHSPEIINFMGTEKEQNFLIIKNLNEFLNPGNIEKIKQSDAHVNYEKKMVVKAKLKEASEFNKTPIFDFDYLVNKRKIDKSTLDNPLVKGTVFNTIFEFKTGHKNINTAFAKYDLNGNIPSLEVYYESLYKSSSLVIGDNDIPDHHKFLWHSNVDTSKPISHVFFAESAKDAISYLELLLGSPTGKAKDFNPFFVSIGGNLDSQGLKEEQLKLHLSILDIVKGTQFFSICDNDLAGEKYDRYFAILTANHLNNSNHTVKFNKHFSEVTFDHTISTKEYEQWKNSIKLWNNAIDNSLGDTPSYGKHFILKENSLIVPLENELQISYTELFVDALSAFHLPSHNFSLHKTSNKALNGDLDWNAELMYKKDPSYFLSRQKRHLDHKIKTRTQKLLKKKQMTQPENKRITKDLSI